MVIVVVEVLGAEQHRIEAHNFITVTLDIIPCYLEYDHVTIFTKKVCILYAQMILFLIK